MKGNAVAVLIITPQGIPLVRDLKKPSPVFWKLPGGRGEENETAEGCAVREIMEEVGMTLSEDQLAVIYTQDKGDHVLTIFQASLPTLPPLKSKGEGDEEVRVFDHQEILTMPDFFPNHRKVVETILTRL